MAHLNQLRFIGVSIVTSLCVFDAQAEPTSPPSKLVISELMYHAPRGAGGAFVELYNAGATEVSLRGWRLASDEGALFEFGPDHGLAAGAFLVVAKDPVALLRRLEAGDAKDRVLGPLLRALKTEKGTVSLQDPSGAIVDELPYSSSFPWPLAADLGGEDPEWRARGLDPNRQADPSAISLERISDDYPGASVENWAPSTRAGGTPLSTNDAHGTPVPIVLSHKVSGSTEEGIVAGKAARLTVTLSQTGLLALRSLEVEVVALRKDGSAGAGRRVKAPPKGEGLFEATLPAQAAGTLVRYRVLLDLGRGASPVSPRPTDPFGWHAYAIPARAKHRGRTYGIFIEPSNWTRLWQNIEAGPITDCRPNPHWNETVDAHFVFDDRAYQVRVRYHGVAEERREGPAIGRWPHPGPRAPQPLRALSWEIQFPRWKRFEGRRSIVLNKLALACPGVDAAFESALLRELGVPSHPIRFARVEINGGYYHYMMEQGGLSAAELRLVDREGAGEGALFESVGSEADLGPWGPGNGSLLGPHCGFSPMQRYASTYARRHGDGTYETRHDDIIELIRDYHAARALGKEELRRYFAARFDVKTLLNVFAVRNWAGVFDDTYHNYFLYRRGSDGRWLILPHEFELDFGGARGTEDDWAARTPDVSFFIGERGPETTKANVLGINHWKDGFLWSFEREFRARLIELSASTLEPKHALTLFETQNREFDLEAWKASPAAPICDLQGRVRGVRAWVRARHSYLERKIGKAAKPPAGSAPAGTP